MLVNLNFVNCTSFVASLLSSLTLVQEIFPNKKARFSYLIVEIFPKMASLCPQIGQKENHHSKTFSSTSHHGPLMESSEQLIAHSIDG